MGRRSLDELQNELVAKENEVVNHRRALEDIKNARAPMEEVHRWKSRAETYEQQYVQQLKYSQEMKSAIGNVTQAAGERGNELAELQRRNAQLMQEQEKERKELKRAELEKEDLQKDLDSLQTTSKYFRDKYKSTQAELRTVQRDQASLRESMAAMAQKTEAQVQKSRFEDSRRVRELN